MRKVKAYISSSPEYLPKQWTSMRRHGGCVASIVVHDPGWSYMRSVKLNPSRSRPLHDEGGCETPSRRNIGFSFLSGGPEAEAWALPLCGLYQHASCTAGLVLMTDAQRLQTHCARMMSSIVSSCRNMPSRSSGSCRTSTLGDSIFSRGFFKVVVN